MQEKECNRIADQGKKQNASDWPTNARNRMQQNCKNGNKGHAAEWLAIASKWNATELQKYK